MWYLVSVCTHQIILLDKFRTKLNLRTDRFDLKYLKVTRTEAGGGSKITIMTRLVSIDGRLNRK